MANIKKNKDTVLFSFWTERDLIDKLKEIGAKEDRTIAYLIRKAIIKYYNYKPDYSKK
jgi:predicted DNA-binding protein